MSRQALLTWLSGLLLAFWIVATVVAVDQGWPAEFGDQGDPADASGEWVSRGTLVSAPLAPMVAQAVFTLLALRPARWWGILGAAGLAVLGIVYVIGGFGEPFDPAASDPPVAVYALFRAVGLALSVGLFAAAVATVVAALRARRLAR